MKNSMLMLVMSLTCGCAFCVTPNTEWQDVPGTDKIGEVISAGGAVVTEADPVWNAQKSGYQPKIADLQTIRAGSAKGATALQKHQSLEPATNYTDAAIMVATNGLRSVDGAARPLPKYLHALDFADSYPAEAAEYYRSRGDGKVEGGCSSVRDGGFLYRNFDFPFDDRAEFVVKMSAGKDRFASVGVAQVGTNLTEQMVTSGKPSRWYKALPGATVDGINENGVACNINVVDGDPQWGGGVSPALHPLAAVRWILDHATNAQHAAEYLAAHIAFPQGLTQNFHYMICDTEKTYIVENGYYLEAAWDNPPFPIMTNYSLTGFGQGKERYDILFGRGNITNAWYTNAYRRETNPPWVSDLAEVIDYTNDIFNAWTEHPKEYFRGKTNNGQPWWQSVHTSIYDITNRTLRVAVQEVDDWYSFQVPSSGGAKIEVDTTLTQSGKAADAKATGDALAEIPRITESNDHEGYARYADIALEADWAAEAVKADKVGGYDSFELERMDEDISRKADRVSNPSAGNLAALDENGNLADSAIASASVVVTNSYGLYEGDWEVDGGLFVYGGNFRVSGYFDISSDGIGFYSRPYYDLPGILPPRKSYFALMSDLSPENETFSNAVLSVGISTNVLATVAQIQNLGTNTVAQIAEFVSAFDGIGITLPEGGVTLAGLLAALVAAVTWLKRTLGKVADNSGKPTNDFATDLLGKQVAIQKVQDIIADDVVPVTGDTSLTKTIATIGGKAIKAPEGGGGDTTFCLKYDPENDVIYYDDGEPEENA